MEVLTPTTPADAAPPPLVEGDALAGYEKYLTDESRRSGQAAAVAFPRTTAEVCGAVQAARDRDLGITVSGARTGIAAGAVPEGGMVLSLERMNRVLGLRRAANGDVLVRCEAGVLLADLQRAVSTGRFADVGSWDPASRDALSSLQQTPFFYPPDPTETSAALGGTIACNASGAHTFRYGPTRCYVNALRVVLADGRCLALERGACRATADGKFALRRADGHDVTGRVPLYPWPATKNAAGYFSGPGMDLLDLFIGSEGTLGIITEAEVRVIPAPETSCAVVTFFAAEAQALAFTRALRDRRDEMAVEAIEYFGPNALTLLRARRNTLGAASGVPECLPDAGICAIYLDLGPPRTELHRALSSLAELAAQHGAAPEVCWSAQEPDERERLRVFRHALPETVNAQIAERRKTHPELTKLGTDMAVPDERLEEILHLYRTHLAGEHLDYVIFGHIGDNHLHVNILPRTPDEYEAGRRLYDEFAATVVRMGGSAAAEHGIGKLKTGFLKLMYGADGLAQMRAVKALMDPESRLGKGTLFE